MGPQFSWVLSVLTYLSSDRASPNFPATGSCSRPNNKGPVTCTPPTVSPTYGTTIWCCSARRVNGDVDLSVLPQNSPDLLTAPTATTPVFIAIAIALSIVFFIIFTLISLRPNLGARFSAALDRPVLHRASAWIGLLGFMIGLFFPSTSKTRSNVTTSLKRFDRILSHSDVVREGCRGLQRGRHSEREWRTSTHCSDGQRLYEWVYPLCISDLLELTISCVV